MASNELRASNPDRFTSLGQLREALVQTGLKRCCLIFGTQIYKSPSWFLLSSYTLRQIHVLQMGYLLITQFSSQSTSFIRLIETVDSTGS